MNGNFLYVRTADLGTHFGGTFCRSDQDLRDKYEDLQPQQAIKVSAARRYVQQGLPRSEAMDWLDEHTAFGRSNVTRQLVEHCLGQIASGTCPVFPATETNVEACRTAMSRVYVSTLDM